MSLLGPLPTTFTPPASCTASFADFYQQPAVGGDYAGPLRTSNCFPPNYASARTAFYSPASICPYGFVSACDRVTSTGVSAPMEMIITCCPSVQGGKAFTCNPDLQPSWAETLACKSAFLSGEFFQNHISVSIKADDSIQTLSAVTTGYKADYNGALNAFGVQLRYQADVESSVTSGAGMGPSGPKATSRAPNGASPTETPSPGAGSPGSAGAADSTKDGVSTNTIVGAAVGGAIGILIVIVMIVGIIVMRRKKSQQQPIPQESEEFSTPGLNPSFYSDSPGVPGVDGNAQKPYVTEVQYPYVVPAEMPTDTRMPEAMGDETWRQQSRLSEAPGDHTWQQSQR